MKLLIHHHTKAYLDNNNNRSQKSHKEQKSFRKYNAASSPILAADYTQGSNNYFTNIPFSNYQTHNSNYTKVLQKKPYNINNQIHLNQTHLAIKKYHMYDNKHFNMSNLQQINPGELKNGMKSDEPVMQNLLNQEEREKLNYDLQKYFDIYMLILNSIKKPHVCYIETQSVLVRLSPIESETILAYKAEEMTKNLPLTIEKSTEVVEANKNDEIISKCETINYTLELANETNIFNQVYTGDANEITLKDLKPNTKYFLRYSYYYQIFNLIYKKF